MALIYSCDDPTFWADASAQARASRIGERVFLFIGFFFLKIITIRNKNKIYWPIYFLPAGILRGGTGFLAKINVAALRVYNDNGPTLDKSV
jgi:hypothetical protein